MRILGLVSLVAALVFTGCGEVDRSPDAGKDSGPDLPRVDLSKGGDADPDQGQADVKVADLSPPDSIKPDSAKPDSSKPDSSKPDLLQVDSGKPDTVAFKTLTDDTFSDFKQGELSESGAKIYASAKGNVQLLDRLDLNADGSLDIVFSNISSSTTRKINSYIYWGGAAGFSASSKAELPTIGGACSSAADLNADGYPDLVFANNHDGTTGKLNSYIYWGSASGFSATSKAQLPTNHGNVNVVADLNRDGHLDVVFSNTGGSGPGGNAFIYWGSTSGFSSTNKKELPTSSPQGLAVGDLNKDGYLDLVTAAWGGSAKGYIYWGSASGYSAAKRAELPTYNSYDIAIADLNKDTYLDVVFSNNHDMGNNRVLNSYIYWGGASGYKATNKAELPTIGASGVSAADLNADGYLDLVFSNHTNGTTWQLNSYIYWGSKPGFINTNKTELPTIGASGNRVADFNGDTYPDLVFNNYYDGSKFTHNSYIYWGAATGFKATNRTELPTLGAGQDGNSPGSLYDRKGEQTFTSRAFDTAVASPTYTTLSWTVTLPKNTALKFQLRSAATSAGLSSATWHGPTSTSDFYVASSSTTSAAINAAHKGQRYIQYRATLGSTDFGNTPILDKVQISFH